ncbi:MAG: S-methyl-5-thioribose-1-phosphate isomerase [Chloroflexi bacterium]|nr:S-methyl-5-thioribose-1-phosphate isomerase [Chloroflexota bacterium]MCL5108165.1 S-methyl-5-thioribose-1-phosphate isomerase [Chloroflexota bacterium]
MKTLWWAGDALALIDQTRLPAEQTVVECRTYQEVGRAIKMMIVRGAPAIGVTAAYGLAIAARQSAATETGSLIADLRQSAAELRTTRPTAVNLAWALERLLGLAEAQHDVAAVREVLLAEAHHMAEEDEEANRRMGRFGADLVKDGDSILTHCNAGGLATVAYGTALGVVRAAHEQGKRVHVFVDETRPFLQGARLTAWELQQEGIPYTLITDSMAGHFLKSQVNLVVVGADRIAANGDVANKIGTYGVAVLAKENGVPFYVAAPLSTVDMKLTSGAEIPIEQRNPEEVASFAGVRTAPVGARAAHPAFDVTPARYVTAIVTEVGVLRPPYAGSLAGAFASQGSERRSG